MTIVIQGIQQIGEGIQQEQQHLIQSSQEIIQAFLDKIQDIQGIQPLVPWEDIQ